MHRESKEVPGVLVPAPICDHINPFWCFHVTKFCFLSISDAKTCKDGNNFPLWTFSPPHWQRKGVLELFLR